MKKRILFAVLCFAFALQLNAQNKELLDINTSTSAIKWSCDYAFYFGGHEGNINFKEGYFIKDPNGSITGGKFIIDMNTIRSTDMDEEEARVSLDDHLKNEDFFDVPNFPNATLEITRVKYHDGNHMKIFADLTIKGETVAINFQAEVDYENKELKTRFKIDRTRWGITYNSKEVEGKLKDGLISDAIGFEVAIKL